MIQRNRMKRLILQSTAVVGAIACGAVLAGVARLASWQLPGSLSTSALHEVAELPPEADRLVTWLPDRGDAQRVLDPATRVQVEAAYVRAWAAIGRYQTTGDTEPVTSTFAEPARSAALAVPRSATASWSIAHHLELQFFALDGMTVAVRDTDANIVRSAVTAGLPTLTDVHETYDVVLALQDGYWRIQQLRRVDTRPPVIIGRTAGGTGATVLAGVRATTARTVPPLHGIGYQLPFDKPLDEKAVAADLATVAKLGLDTVRVPLPYEELGGDAADEEKLELFRKFLDLAAAQQVRVVPVLFSGLAGLTPDVWAATDMHLRAVVGALRDHQAIAMWDIADAPDRRATGVAGSVEVYGWVVHTVTELRTVDPDRPATVSWAGVSSAASPSVNGLFDAVSLAWDGAHDELASALVRVSRNAAGRPLLLSRYGLSTYNGIFPGGHTEHDQAYDVQQTRLIAARAGVRGTVFAWLRDGMTTEAATMLPWQSGPHGAEGLLHADGTAKRANTLVGKDANLGRPIRPPVADPLRKPFWWLVTMVGAAVLLLVAVLVRRRRRATRERKLAGPARAPRHLAAPARQEQVH
ncbi:hypothetical protein AB0J80_21245 [Actinoplanes sp. NPDC049548]|uniref:hypothetical protein n=1 Tax=Actinoplanes sp. NPDC049548 TaxID=3155152 RepID=UPI003426A17E